MNNDTFDPVDAAALDQFLLECEPPTPPTAALSLAMASDLSPKVFLHSEVAQPSSHPPKQVKGALMLDEADKQAILAALDDNNDSPDQKGSLICSNFYLQQQQCFDERSLVSPSNTSQSAEEQARKLKLQRAKATKRRNRHRQRVNEE
ncbi:unnamed protein product [Phytophthora lilii]|uniref:Unnamed protein product n=1 Tax=Phytophthora lilii TaxID=2077276 RepID=A0A9W6WRM4_9STRA|nr:unnamed protein product [Phytophthora lilii]